MPLQQNMLYLKVTVGKHQHMDPESSNEDGFWGKLPKTNS